MFVPTCFAINSARRFPSLHILAKASLGFLITAILTGVRGKLIVVFICTALMINGIEHFFIYLVVILYILQEYNCLKTAHLYSVVLQNPKMPNSSGSLSHMI